MKIIDEKDFERFSPVFKGKRGNRLARYLMRVFSVDKVHQVYNNSGAYHGSEFASRLLNDLQVKYVISNSERLSQLPRGAFITISNHPYGGLDGIILVDMIAGLRHDYKLMVNETIGLVKTMEENFIVVTPKTNKNKSITAKSIHGIRETVKWLESGHPVGFFPSGAVSDFSLKELRIRDRQWQTSILRVIKAAKVPILPVRFFDTNSGFFYFLGLISWRIRLLRLPAELFNKRKRVHRLAFGNIITVQEQEQFTDVESFGLFLRESVYKMSLPDSFITQSRTATGK